MDTILNPQVKAMLLRELREQMEKEMKTTATTEDRNNAQSLPDFGILLQLDEMASMASTGLFSTRSPKPVIIEEQPDVEDVEEVAEPTTTDK